MLALVDLQKDELAAALGVHDEVDVGKLLLAVRKLAAEGAAVVDVHLARELARTRRHALVERLIVAGKHEPLQHLELLALDELLLLGRGRRRLPRLGRRLGRRLGVDGRLARRAKAAPALLRLSVESNLDANAPRAAIGALRDVRVALDAIVPPPPVRALAAAVHAAVHVGRAGGKLHRVDAPAHGARALPLVAAPHHLYGLWSSFSLSTA